MAYNAQFDLRGKRIQDTYTQVVQYDTSSNTVFTGQGSSIDNFSSSFAVSASSAATAAFARTATSASYAPQPVMASASYAAQADNATSASYASVAEIAVNATGLTEGAFGASSSLYGPFLSGEVSIDGITTGRGLYLDQYSVVQASQMSSLDMAYASGLSSNVQEQLDNMRTGSGVYSASLANSASWAPASANSDSASYVDTSGSLSYLGAAAGGFQIGGELSCSGVRITQQYPSIDNSAYSLYLPILPSDSQPQVLATLDPFGQVVTPSWGDGVYIDGVQLTNPVVSGSMIGTASYANRALSASWAPDPTVTVVSASWASSSISSSFSYNSGSMIVTSDTQVFITTKNSLNRTPLPIIIFPGVTNQPAGAHITMSGGITTNGVGGMVDILGGTGLPTGGDVNLWCGAANGKVNLKDADGINRLSLSGSVITLNGSLVGGSITSSLFGTSSWALNAESASYVKTIEGGLVIESGSLVTTFNGYNPGVSVGGIDIESNDQTNGTIGWNAVSIDGATTWVKRVDGSSGLIHVSAPSLYIQMSPSDVSGSSAITTTQLRVNGLDNTVALGGSIGTGFSYGNPVMLVSGSNRVTVSGSISASLGFTGSLFGTASNAVSSSWAPSNFSPQTFVNTGSGTQNVDDEWGISTPSSVGVQLGAGDNMYLDAQTVHFGSSFDNTATVVCDSGSFVGPLIGTASFASQSISASYAPIIVQGNGSSLDQKVPFVSNSGSIDRLFVDSTDDFRYNPTNGLLTVTHISASCITGSSSPSGYVAFLGTASYAHNVDGRELVSLPYSASAQSLTPIPKTGSMYFHTEGGVNLLYIYSGLAWTSCSLV